MRIYVRTLPAIYYSNSESVYEQDHTRMHTFVSTSAENGPAMAGPAGPVPAPMKLLVGRVWEQG